MEEIKDSREVIEVPEGYEIVTENNVLNIVGVFNEDMLHMVYNFVNNLDEESEDPIKINITSEGGSADVLNAVIDLLKSTRRELHATVHGYAYSSALGLLCACDKRAMGRLSKLMYHKCIYSIEGNLQNHKDALEESANIQNEYDNLILGASTGITKKDLSNINYKEWFINKETAIELGLINVL